MRSRAFPSPNSIAVGRTLARLSFDRACREAGDDVLLREYEDDDGRQNRQRDEGENEVPLGGVFALVNHYAERPWIESVGVEHHQWQQIGIPAVDEGDDGDRGEDRPRQWQRDVTEEVDVTAAIHERGV